MLGIAVDGRRISIIVFSLFFSWLLAFPFEGQVLYALSKQNHFDAHSMVFGSIALHFLGLLLSGFFIKSINDAKRLMKFSIIFCIVGSSIFFFRPSILWNISLLIVSFLAGACVASWGFFYKKYTQRTERIKTAADGLIFLNVLMIGMNVVAINISANAGLILSVFILALAFFFTTKLKAFDEKNETVEISQVSISLKKPLLFLCIFILVITINSGFMYQVINPAFEHHQFVVSWYWALPYIISLYIMKRLPVTANRTYILYIAIAMIGFSFLFFMALDRSVISYLIVDTFMLGACGVYDLFWWSILGEMLDFHDNPAKVLGIGLSSNVLGVLIGGILGNQILHKMTQYENISVLALIVVFITLIILPPLHKQLSILLKSHVFLTTFSAIGCAEQRKTIDCLPVIAQLTKRENEIVALLLKGRTYKMIADELYLSENTIKTHIKNIYSKYNVKSKVELINLLLKHDELGI